MKDPKPAEVPVHRHAVIPDSIRIERCKRLPEFGPKIVFLSGGSALRETSRVLKTYTHNSIHLITPFDSGGSSAVIREAFRILGVGDLRNRLMALADESDLGSPEVSALFSYRLSVDGEAGALRTELESMVEGVHPLVLAIPPGLRQLIRIHLRKFVQRAPEDFDLRGASLGNLVLVGGYFVNQRDFDSVLYLFSKLVSVRGVVRPMANGDLHLCARHENGEYTHGQHELGKRASVARGRIDDLFLVDDLTSHEPVEIEADPTSLSLLEQAALLCFPMGSFFGSLLANTLPKGVGRAICASDALKVYVPNAGSDPEMEGYTLSGAIEKLLEFVRRDVDGEIPTSRILDYVLVDSNHGDYRFDLNLERVRELGVGVIDLPLAAGNTIDPTRLVHALLSLA